MAVAAELPERLGVTPERWAEISAARRGRVLGAAAGNLKGLYWQNGQ